MERPARLLRRLLPPGDDRWTDTSWVERRPPPRPNQREEGRSYLPDPELREAVELALTLGEPLLVTGEPGCGKTQLAHWVADRLGLKDTLQLQVRSTSTSRELLYTFDTIAYFRAAHLAAEGVGAGALDKWAFIQKGPLWRALEADRPQVVLIDEIDKAPRDFPNDLLHELDQMSFTVPEIEVPPTAAGGVPGPLLVKHETPANRPLVIITSNQEHRLPEAFLRRCVYHHITLTPERIQKILDKRRGEFGDFGRPAKEGGLIDLALERFLELRQMEDLTKRPSTHELLVWCRALSLWSGCDAPSLKVTELADLPFLGLLLKSKEDWREVGYRFDEDPKRRR